MYLGTCLANSNVVRILLIVFLLFKRIPKIFLISFLKIFFWHDIEQRRLANRTQPPRRLSVTADAADLRAPSTRSSRAVPLCRTCCCATRSATATRSKSRRAFHASGAVRRAGAASIRRARLRQVTPSFSISLSPLSFHLN